MHLYRTDQLAKLSAGDKVSVQIERSRYYEREQNFDEICTVAAVENGRLHLVRTNGIALAPVVLADFGVFATKTYGDLHHTIRLGLTLDEYERLRPKAMEPDKILASVIDD